MSRSNSCPSRSPSTSSYRHSSSNSPLFVNLTHNSSQLFNFTIISLHPADVANIDNTEEVVFLQVAPGGTPVYYLVLITSARVSLPSTQSRSSSRLQPSPYPRLLSQPQRALPADPSVRPRPQTCRPSNSRPRGAPPPFFADTSPPSYQEKDPYRHHWQRGLARTRKQVLDFWNLVWRILKRIANDGLEILQLLFCAPYMVNRERYMVI
ncbi:uncharacterized protein BDR25DRAFT_55989 [Lindgomyces ingoldianus]|uniref:Uncharacterized protein n=1 Tax=Lindgomyces ingoldianus TaxID=673940 RepID=A0ACB6QNL5_9PLEO|nr:uncharacterized protein BDR25DRAFT_55989 [Lindgomyces ingoldianus]KAF2468583.1 hypothetical protein BDR25DRAFT_55989 [Lindgomyces ingoldianus]